MRGPGHKLIRYLPQIMDNGLVSQANRQVQAAGGVPIQWNFAENVAAEHVSDCSTTATCKLGILCTDAMTYGGELRRGILGSAGRIR